MTTGSDHGGFVRFLLCQCLTCFLLTGSALRTGVTEEAVSLLTVCLLCDCLLTDVRGEICFIFFLHISNPTTCTHVWLEMEKLKGRDLSSNPRDREERPERGHGPKKERTGLCGKQSSPGRVFDPQSLS